ncbi:MAG: hypothetical protein R2752_03930 [Vicinamibacterales bacterium]
MIRVNLLAAASGPAPAREWLPKEQQRRSPGWRSCSARAMVGYGGSINA